MPDDGNDGIQAVVTAEATDQSKSAEGTNSVRYCAEIFPGPDVPLPATFSESVIEIEKTLGMPVWLLIQNGEPPWSSLGLRVYEGIKKFKNEIEEDKPVAILLDSPGGDAQFAYRIGRIFQRRTKHLTVLVPQYAKSAAALLALGASKLIMGRDAELGPLDVQIFDPDREDFDSALNAVQSLERLNAFSLTAIDQAMRLLMLRTGKKSDTLLPLVLDYASSFVRPLLEKIDTVDYTKKSRDLKVAEQYATRLMRQNYSRPDADRIANHLVERYSTHGFVIDREEAEECESIGPTSAEYFGLGLKTLKDEDWIDEIVEKLEPFLDTLTAIGRLREVQP